MKANRFVAAILIAGLCIQPGPFGVFAALAAAQSDAPATLLDLRAGKRGVTFRLSRPTGVRTSFAGEPPTLFVMLDGAVPSDAARGRSLKAPGVSGVVVSADGATTTVALSMDGRRDYTSAWAGNELVIEFGDPIGGAVTAAPAAAEPAEAETPAAEVPARPAPASRAAEPAKGGNALIESISMEPIDFNFRDADLVGILRNFAVKFNKNIVIGPGVGGRVNMQLRDVPFDEAFGILLSQMELVAVQKSPSVIEIIKASEMPVLTQVFSLKYRFAPDLLPTINAAMGAKEKERAVVSVDLGSNALIVTSTSDMLQKVKRMIDQLDIESPQISIRARLVEVTAGTSFNWGAAYSLRSYSARRGENTNAHAVLDMENFAQDGSGNVTNLTALARYPKGGVLDFVAVLDRKSYYGLINALKSDTRNKTLSEPMILTGNNKSSKIHVGQNLPVKTIQTSQTSTVQSYQFIQEGVDLDVTPIVSPGSNVISFKIRIGVSEFLGYQNDAPITTERTATTEVSVESGKTVVIAGLIKDKQTNSDAGIPILKDIPLLGYFFKRKGKTNDKTELLIFITPELLSKG